MNVLAFDTCFSACSVAVAAAGPHVTHAEHMAMETGHAEALTPMIARVMRAAGLGFASLQRIVVTNGPGTFTGVRTGVAAARALALATAAEVVAVSSLWAMAAEADAALAGSATVDAILVAMDARKGQLYVQAVARGGRALTEPLLLDADAAAALLPDLRLMGTGNAAGQLMAAAQRAARSTLIAPDALGFAGIKAPDARHLIAAAGLGSIRGPLLPLYLRQPDAKPQAGKSLPWSSP